MLKVPHQPIFTIQRSKMETLEQRVKSVTGLQ